MRYADTLLSEGEVVVLRSRQHWLALLLEARAAVALWVLGIVLLGLVMAMNLDAQVSQVISVIALVSLGLGLILFAYRWWHWWAQDYIVTNRRLMKVTGILNKRSSDSSLEKINDAVLDQNVLGRILNYGDLDILTAAGESAVDYFRMLNGAKEFKRVILNQKHALEMEYQFRQPPSPPFRAEPVNMNGEPTMPPGPPPSRPAEPAPPTYDRWQSASQEAPAAAEPAPWEAQGDQPTATTPVTPPAPARPPVEAARPPADAARPPAGEAPPATAASGERDASLEITQTLARLADLRDRGAIDAEEYEQKKDELLRRL